LVTGGNLDAEQPGTCSKHQLVCIS